MTRDELIKQGASKVRRSPALYALYKKYVTEDAKEMYASGRLPKGCFGCQFNSIFSRWKKHVSLNKSDTSKLKDMAVYSAKKVDKAQKKKAAPSGDRSYQLKSPTKKLFFKGKVLSRYSSSEDWLGFINHPKDPAKVKARKDLFSKLPGSGETEKPKEAPKEIKETITDAVTDFKEVDSKEESETKKVSVKVKKS